MLHYSLAHLRWSWRWLAYSGVGALAYLLTLLATMPAGLFLPHAQGTIWQGSAQIERVGSLQWRWSPWRSLSQAGWAADWTMDELSGQALLQPSRLMLEHVRGQSDLAALGPLLSIPCEGEVQVDFHRLVLGGQHHAVEGRMTSAAARCKGMPVPPLLLRANGNEMQLAPLADRNTLLLGGTLSPAGHLHLRATPLGARLLPFLPAIIDTNL